MVPMNLQMKEPNDRSHAPDIPPLESLNWLIHLLYTKFEFDKCKSLINLTLDEAGMRLEYPSYCLGMIQMLEGNPQDALCQFLACCQQNPHFLLYRKQAARCLFMLGRHEEALTYYSEATKVSQDDWELYYDQALCHQYKADDLLAEEYLLEAVKHTKEGKPFAELARLRTDRGDYDGAIEVLKQALSYRSDQPDLLAKLGLLYLKKGDETRAFEQLGAALTYRPNHFQAILAAATIMITHGDYEVALGKYRMALRDAPEDPILWNNCGVAYFGKRKLLATMVCLRRASYLAPLSWLIMANRGVLYLHTGQYATAFRMFMASIQLRRHEKRATKCQAFIKRPSEVENKVRNVDSSSYSMGMLYGLLAMALAGLGDRDGAKEAHLQACNLDTTNPVLPLNMAIELSLSNSPELPKFVYECQQRLIKYGMPRKYFDSSEISNILEQFQPTIVESETQNGAENNEVQHSLSTAEQQFNCSKKH